MARATAPAVAVALLVALTVVTAAVVGAAALVVDVSGASTRASVSLAVDSADDRLQLTHRGGDPLDLTELSLSIAVDGRPLDEQPPVQFFAAPGFRSGPTGPFNRAADPTWRPGERTTLRLASTNDPAIDAGDVVTVQISSSNRTIVRTRTRAS